MASLTQKTNGIWQIQFTHHRRRATLSIGSRPEKDARSVKAHLESILEVRWVGGSLPREEAAWLDKIDDDLHGKLARLGLVQPRSRAQLEPFLEVYIASRTDVGDLTRRNLKAAAAKFVAFFGPSRDISTITEADAKRFAISLETVKAADATQGRLVIYGRQFFGHAIDSRQISVNPFKGIKAPKQQDRTRHHLIDEATAQKVLQACPSAVWRLRFVLARYGGLRTPLEVRRLKWADINWEFDKIGVRGKGGDGSITRYTPIFPEIRRELDAVWDDPAADSVFVVPRQSHATNRDGLLKILATAGLAPWQRLWHNLRMTRHSELSAIYPRHIVCQWLGNSEDVADQHYTMVSDEQFRLASAGKTFAPGTENPTPKLL